ncbi:hypothetical protein FQZ97_794910 [compost metagenome]
MLNRHDRPEHCHDYSLKRSFEGVGLWEALEDSRVSKTEPRARCDGDERARLKDVSQQMVQPTVDHEYGDEGTNVWHALLPGSLENSRQARMRRFPLLRRRRAYVWSYTSRNVCPSPQRRT